jgi:hypothetical protein
VLSVWQLNNLPRRFAQTLLYRSRLFLRETPEHSIEQSRTNQSKISYVLFSRTHWKLNQIL